MGSVDFRSWFCY